MPGRILFSRRRHRRRRICTLDGDAMPYWGRCLALSVLDCWVPECPPIRGLSGLLAQPEEPTMSKKSLYRTRVAAYHRQAGRCYYCGVLMWLSDASRFAAQHSLSCGVTRWLQCTAEHLKPRRDGGNDSPPNVVAACYCCNLRRHKGRNTAPTPDAYRNLVRRRVSRRGWHALPIFERQLV